MSSLDMHARLTMDGKQAKAELASVTQETKGLTADVDRLGKEGRETSAEFQMLVKELTSYKTELASLKSDHASAVKQIDALGRELDQLRGKGGKLPKTYDAAAGSVGNLTSQFNDIGIMLAAGQNPLQLAIQQGTQIGQVFQQTGVKGKDAFKLILSGLTSMISPINLITIGSIAAGAALVNWLGSGEEKADDLEQRLEGVANKIKEAELYIRQRETGAGSQEQLTLDDKVAAAEKALADAERERDQSDPEAYQFAVERVRLAEEAVAAAKVERDLGLEKLATAEKLKAEEEALAKLDQKRAQDRATADDMLFQLEQENTLRQVALTYGEDSLQLTLARADAERAAFERVLETLDVSEELKDELRQALAQGQALASTDMSAGIWSAVNAARELSGILASLQTQGLSDLKTAQIEFDYRADPVGRAGALAGARFDADTGDTSGLDPILQQGLAQQRQEYIDNAEAVASLRQETAEWRKEQAAAAKAGAKGARGAAKATKEQRDAVKEYIDQLQLEIELAREFDPIQQEMIRNRELLASATAAERAEIEQLITLREEEAAAQQRLEETRDMTGDTVRDFFDAWREGGDAGIAALQRLEDKLWDVAMQALIFGEGPLGILFGGGLMGLFGFKGGGEIPGYDSGGMIYGHGGPKDDRILMMSSRGPIKGSAGEFMVNAEATAKFRPLLEAINSGAPLPGFAEGGAISGGGGWSMAAPVFQFIDQSRGVEVETREERTPEGGRLFKFVIADQVADAMTRPGSSANRALRQRGVRQPMVLR